MYGYEINIGNHLVYQSKKYGFSYTTQKEANLSALKLLSEMIGAEQKPTDKYEMPLTIYVYKEEE